MPHHRGAANLAGLRVWLQRACVAAVCIQAGVAAAMEETRVPLDADSRLERLDARTARSLKLFTEIGGFRGAQLFVRADSSYVLEIELDRDGRFVRDRRELAPAEVTALRQDVSRRLAARPAMDPEDRSGRTLLLGGSTLLGLGFYDWALPTATDLHDKNAVAAGMLAGAGSFFVPWLLTRNAPVTMGMAHLSLYGGTRGIVYGMLALEMVTASDAARATSDGRLASGLAGSAVAGAGGYFWARARGMSPGGAHAIGTGGDFGLAFGLGIAELLDGDRTLLDGDEGGLQYAAGLAGAAGGMFGGRWIERRRPTTWGDVEVTRMAGLVGAAAGLAVCDATGSENDDALLASGLAGAAGGLVIGHHLVTSTQYTPGEALLVDTGAVAGALLGLGLAYLIGSDTGSSSDAYTASAALGAAGGFALTWATTRGEASRHAAVGSGWSVAIEPLALLAARSGRRAAPQRLPVTPFVRVRHGF